jgi:hypothetical protein
LYELRRGGWDVPLANSGAPAGEQEELIQRLADLGAAADYPPGFKPAARLGRIRQALHGSMLKPPAVRFLLSFARKLLKEQTNSRTSGVKAHFAP